MRVRLGASRVRVRLGASVRPMRLGARRVGWLLLTRGVARGLVGLSLGWSWTHELGAAAANAILSVILFLLMDRLKLRA